MAKAQASGGSTLVGLILIIVGSFYFEFLRPIAIVIAIFFGGLIFFAILYGIWTADRNRVLLAEVSDITRAEVGKHLDTLARQRLILLKKDRYGVVDDKAWTDEIARFMNKVVMTKLNAKQKAVLGNQIAVAAENGRKLEVRTNAFKIVNDLIEGPVCDRAAEIERETGFDDAMSPIDYEHFCATVLRRKGWKCEVTKASGDQGIDVLATKGGIRLALQCKMYSSPVGNAAVQEIVAAKVHVGATVAAVVATNGYTRSAHDLAHTTKTLLLHHGDLLRIEELVSA